MCHCVAARVCLMNERPPQIEKQKIWPWPMLSSWKFTFSAARSVDFGSTRQKIAAIFLCNRRRLVHQSSSKIKRSVSFHRKPGGEYLTRSIYGCTVSCKSKRLTVSFYKFNYIHYLTPWIIWRPVEDETSEKYLVLCSSGLRLELWKRPLDSSVCF